MPRLPIDDVLSELLAALATSSSVVLQAPPGAGKTTRVPLALLDANWVAGRKIIVLEPRRLAARAAAHRMAATLGEPIGRTVGFRIRGETRVSHETKIEVVTEGVLTRMLLDDPSLDDVAAVMLDEFHERSLQADLALALARQSQEILRPDLRIVIMSATLDGDSIARLLDAVVVVSEGRAFPVEMRYAPRRDEARVELAVAGAVATALMRDEGSILAFLPGVAEIGRCFAALERMELPPNVRLIPLFGTLSSAEQDEAIAAAAPGMRKVVLATSIAESSLTIDGVRVVVDSGLSRIPRFSSRSGMSRLVTVRASLASVNQRSGRAGRTAPGVCYRLWDQSDDAQLLSRSRPEILEADLASLALDLAAAGVLDVAELRWLDVPPAAALAQAGALLGDLGAIDDRHRITQHGVAMSRVSAHPRISHMLLVAAERGNAATACVIAALLSERDVLRRDGMSIDADIRSRIDIVSGHSQRDSDRDAVRRVRDEARRLRDALRVSHSEVVDDSVAGPLLALAYPDRVAQRRNATGHRYLLRNGTGVELPDPGTLANAPYLVIADADGHAARSRIYLAAPLELSDILALCAGQIVSESVMEWDSKTGSVVAARRESLGAIVLREIPDIAIDEDRAADVLLDALLRSDQVGLPWSEDAFVVRQRIAFVHSIRSEWPDVSDLALHSSMVDWLKPHLVGLRRRSDVERLPLAEILLSLLTWDQRRMLDELAPPYWNAPTGTRVKIDYSGVASPSISIRLQEVFGVKVTPTVGVNTPLTFHLLSPARRPVQVTRDIAGFWRTSYFEVRKELRGRYPKHYWPEDPLSAEPTRRVKK